MKMALQQSVLKQSNLLGEITGIDDEVKVT